MLVLREVRAGKVDSSRTSEVVSSLSWNFGESVGREEVPRAAGVKRKQLEGIPAGRSQCGEWNCKLGCFGGDVRQHVDVIIGDGRPVERSIIERHLRPISDHLSIRKGSLQEGLRRIVVIVQTAVVCDAYEGSWGASVIGRRDSHAKISLEVVRRPSVGVTVSVQGRQTIRSPWKRIPRSDAGLA